MRKFRVIKEYPGGPEVGRIFKEHDGDLTDRPVIYYNHSWIDPLNWPQHFEEVKEPLFITEDGVDMFEGDEYFLCMGDKAIKTQTSSRTDYKKGPARFADYKKALQWIEKNHPQYSLKDIEDAMLDLYGYSSIKEAMIGELTKRLKFNKK